MKILKLCLIENCYDRNKWQVPCLLFVSLSLYELSASFIMKVLSNLYASITTENSILFWNTISYAFFLVIIVSFLKSVSSYASDSCAISWRGFIVDFIHRNYMVERFESDGDKMCFYGLDNIDQRTTQDVDRLTTQTAKLFEAVAVLPIVIIYYTFYIACLFGWISPALCFVYFSCGCIASYFIAKEIVVIVYQQELMEGEFRSAHVCYQLFKTTIHLLKGQQLENNRIKKLFQMLVDNKTKLINRTFWLNLFTNWFAYTGGIGKNYYYN